MPLYNQLAQEIARQIASGQLTPGQRLGAVAAMASELGVAQSTIRRALAELADAGLVTKHVGRGTFVADTRRGEKDSPAAPPPGPAGRGRQFEPPPAVEASAAARKCRMGASRILDLLMALASRPGMIRFTAGVPAPGTVRDGLLQQAAGDLLKTGQEPYLDYGPPGGLPELREAVARLLRSDGADISAGNVLITHGSRQAAFLLAMHAREESRSVLVETPCDAGIPGAFGAAGHWVRTIDRDDEGPLPESVAAATGGGPALLHLCPQLHNPTGTDLRPLRRKALAAILKQRPTLVVADESYRGMHLGASSPASLLTDFGLDRTAVIGSLSKSLACGLRIGWLVAGAERIRSVLSLKRAIDLGCPPLMQAIAARLLQTGEYLDHLRRIRRLYQIRRDATLQALRRHMPDGVTWTTPDGGFQLWLTLPEGYSSLTLFLMAVERGVAFVPGPQHDVDHRFVHCLRLAYGSLRPERIEEGIRLLAEATRELLRQRPTEGLDAWTDLP